MNLRADIFNQDDWNRFLNAVFQNRYAPVGMENWEMNIILKQYINNKSERYKRIDLYQIVNNYAERVNIYNLIQIPHSSNHRKNYDQHHENLSPTT